MTEALPNEISQEFDLLWEAIIEGKIVDMILQTAKDKNPDFGGGLFLVFVSFLSMFTLK